MGEQVHASQNSFVLHCASDSHVSPNSTMPLPQIAFDGWHTHPPQVSPLISSQSVSTSHSSVLPTMPSPQESPKQLQERQSCPERQSCTPPNSHVSPGSSTPLPQASGEEELLELLKLLELEELRGTQLHELHRIVGAQSVSASHASAPLMMPSPHDSPHPASQQISPLAPHAPASSDPPPLHPTPALQHKPPISVQVRVELELDVELEEEELMIGAQLQLLHVSPGFVQLNPGSPHSSPASGIPLPHPVQVPQSSSQLPQVSPIEASQTVSPHVGPATHAQELLHVSPGSAQLNNPGSHSSPGSRIPLPHAGHMPQSSSQLAQFSPIDASQTASPHVGPVIHRHAPAKQPPKLLAQSAGFAHVAPSGA